MVLTEIQKISYLYFPETKIKQESSKIPTDMNILIDCITLVRKNGAAEYQRRIITELLAKHIPESVNIFGVYDSRVGIIYDDMQPSILSQNGVKMIDIANTDISTLVSSYNIDRFYIGCVQVIASYPGIANVKCEVLCVVHDLSFEEIEREDIDIYLKAQKKSLSSLIFWLIFKMKKCRRQNYINSIVELTLKNPRVTLIVVSEYTRHSLMYSYNIPADRIVVLYSPERIYSECDGECSKEVQQLVKSGRPFFLLLGVQHRLKNTRKAINAFCQFSQSHPEYILFTAGKKIPQACPQHLSMGFLSDMDLYTVFKSCHALIYPTLFEGFGYPPLEVMHYGKPVIVSNIGSVREVLENAPIYFSPLYETDVFKALNEFCNIDYDIISKRCQEQYKKVAQRQSNDLQILLNMILNED